MASVFGPQNSVSAEEVVATQGFVRTAQKAKASLGAEAVFTASTLFGQARYKCHLLQFSSKALEKDHIQSFTGKKKYRHILRKTQWWN